MESTEKLWEREQFRKEIAKSGFEPLGSRLICECFDVTLISLPKIWKVNHPKSHTDH